MEDETQQADINAELETLRRTNAELTEKSKTRKAKIAELEAANATMQAQLKQLIIDAPMKALATEMSTCPELFIEQFQKSMRLEMIEDKLTIVSAEDDKPINIPFEGAALLKHLTDEKHPQSKAFRAIMISTRASGSAGNHITPTQRPKKPVDISKMIGHGRLR